MLTKEERATINRANALKSTGPRTEEGKKRASLNATRHGITGQVVVLPTEDMEAYFEFQKSFFDEFQPQGPVESQCVQVMADASWKLNRSIAYQDQILSQKAVLRFEDYPDENNHELNAAFAVASVVAQHTRDLANMSMYEQRNFRMFEKAHDRLQTVQAQRKEAQRVEMVDAAALFHKHEADELAKQNARQAEAAQAAAKGQPAPAPYVPLPYSPAKDGFVFSVVDIQAHNDRRRRLSEGYRLPIVQSAAA